MVQAIALPGAPSYAEALLVADDPNAEVDGGGNYRGTSLRAIRSHVPYKLEPCGLSFAAIQLSFAFV